jgi:hypothetical protein
MSSKVSSDRLPSYIKATRPALEIFSMDGYFPYVRVELCLYALLTCALGGREWRAARFLSFTLGTPPPCHLVRKLGGPQFRRGRESLATVGSRTQNYL